MTVVLRHGWRDLWGGGTLPGLENSSEHIEPKALCRPGSKDKGRGTRGLVVKGMDYHTSTSNSTYQ